MSGRQDEDDDGLLQDVWSVYFHDPDDPAWTLESYQRVADVGSVDDFWCLHDALGPYVTTSRTPGTARCTASHASMIGTRPRSQLEE